MNGQHYDYARHAGRALMALKGESIASACRATGINPQSLECFMAGNDAVLSDISFHALFHYLGVIATDDGAKLDHAKVHYLSLDCGLRHKRAAVKKFKTLLPLMDGLTALELPTRGNVTTILVRGTRVRVVVLIKHGLAGAPKLSDLDLVPGSFRGYESIKHIPDYYMVLLTQKQVRANYFDLILEGDFTNEAIDLVRLVALDRDVTLTDVVAALVQGQVLSASKRNIQIDGESYYQEKVVRLFPDHFRVRAAA